MMYVCVSGFLFYMYICICESDDDDIGDGGGGKKHTTNTNYIEKCTPHSTPYTDTEGEQREGKREYSNRKLNGNRFLFSVTKQKILFRVRFEGCMCVCICASETIIVLAALFFSLQMFNVVVFVVGVFHLNTFCS